MGARCHADSCGIQWSEVVEGGIRKFKADVRTGNNNETLICSGNGLQVNFDGASEAITGLDSPPWLSSASGSGIRLNSEFRGNRLIKHIAFSDAPASNPFAGLAADSESGTPDYGSGEFQITNDTGREGLLIITGMYELYYTIRAGLPLSSDSRAGKITVGAQTLPVVGAVPEITLTPYNAQISTGIVLRNAPSPTYPANAVQRHEFDISGLVNTPVTESDELGRQEKSSKAAFVYQVNIPGGATVHWRCFAFFNGSDQTTNVNLTPFRDSGPRRGFRISEVTASIIPIPVNETIET